METDKSRYKSSNRNHKRQERHEHFKQNALRYTFYKADTPEFINETIAQGIHHKRSRLDNVRFTFLDERSCHDVTATPKMHYVFVVRVALGDTLFSPDFNADVLNHADTVLTYTHNADNATEPVRKYAKANAS